MPTPVNYRAARNNICLTRIIRTSPSTATTRGCSVGWFSSSLRITDISCVIETAPTTTGTSRRCSIRTQRRDDLLRDLWSRHATRSTHLQARNPICTAIAETLKPEHEYGYLW